MGLLCYFVWAYLISYFVWAYLVSYFVWAYLISYFVWAYLVSYFVWAYLISYFVWAYLVSYFVWAYLVSYCASQNFRDRKISRIASKRGGRNIRDKHIREGGSDTLRNTITWLLCLCGSSDL